MDKNIFSEALYASHSDIVTMRRKSLVWPAVTLVTGIALLVVNSLLDGGGNADDVKSLLVLMGGVVTIVGLALVLTRLLGRGEPYHKASHSRLKFENFSFGLAQREVAVQAVRSGDVERLKALPQADVGSIIVMVYASADGSFVAMQPFAYEELEYRPICDICVVRR